MSQTKQWQANLAAADRVTVSTGATQGAGATTRLYVGRDGAFMYASYLRFALTHTPLTPLTSPWAGVGKIVSAIMSLYTDDGLGVVFDVSLTAGPQVRIRRLTQGMNTHSNNPNFVSGDYMVAASTPIH